MRSTLLREAGVTACLYLAGLCLAAWAARPSPADEDKALPLFSLAAGELESLSYDGSKGKLSASRDPQAPERFLLRVEKAGAAAADFVAGENFTAALQAFAPFQALRAVGGAQSTPAELADFGLAPGQGEVLAMQTKGAAPRRIELQVGKASYGSKSLYVREGRDGRVLLAPNAIFEDLRRAEDRLVERRLFSLPFERARQLQVRGGAGTLVLFPQRGASGEVQTWSAEGATPERVELATTFVERIARLRLIQLAPEAEETRLQSISQAPLLELSLSAEDGSSENLRVVEDAGGIWAQGSFTRRWAKLSPNRVLPLVQDFAALTGAALEEKRAPLLP